MSARDDILGSIRTSLKRGPLGEAKEGELAARLADPPRNLIPKRAVGLDHAGQVDLFVDTAMEVQTTVERVASLDDVPEAVAAYLASQNLPSELVVAPDPQLDGVPWERRPLLQVRKGKPEPADAVGVSACFAGIAETGTLLLTSGPEHPSTLNFLPDTHVVVVRSDQVVPTYEEAWTRLRERQRGRAAEGAMPRTVNFVTGPSRTGDIEQRIQLGAHGPRRLHLVVVDPDGVAKKG
jgi:L-lactate dehydrogenase complex protein LldG